MPKLSHLQILRAFAALAVVLDHALRGLVTRGFPYQRFVPSGDLAGHLGVCVFFVISGFIMMRQSARNFGQPRASATFLFRRFSRIVPMYWLATLVWFSIHILTHEKLDNVGRQLLLSLFFIPNIYSHGLNPVVGVGWTLNLEVAFYVLFGIALSFPRFRGISLSIMSVLGLWWFCSHLHGIGWTATSLLILYGNQVVPLFAAGIVLALLANHPSLLTPRQWPVSPAWVLPLVLPGLFLIPAALPIGDSAFKVWQITLIVASVPIVWLCIRAGDERLDAFGRALCLLGEASYAIYLFHTFLLDPAILLAVTTARALHLDQAKIVATAALLTALAISAAAGLVIHLLIERPMMRAIRGLPIIPTRELPDYDAGSKARPALPAEDPA